MQESGLKELMAVEGSLEAEIIKSKLESFRIPVLLKFESAGHIFGITMNGLGKVSIMVPEDVLAEAKRIVLEG
jgi:hypothetical protein